jgi:tRNA A37 methylthiotransferase MiaB
MPQVSKLIIKKRAKNLRELGELILKKVKSKLSLPREVLIEELNLGLAVGYDQNYIKHKVPLVGVPVGEIVRI